MASAPINTGGAKGNSFFVLACHRKRKENEPKDNSATTPVFPRDGYSDDKGKANSVSLHFFCSCPTYLKKQHLFLSHLDTYANLHSNA